MGATRNCQNEQNRSRKSNEYFFPFRLLCFYLVHCCLVVDGAGETDVPEADHAALYMPIRVGSPCAGDETQQTRA